MGKIIKDQSGKVLAANGGAFQVDATIDSNIVAGNIKSGVSILGVEGTYQGGGGIQLTGYTQGAVVNIWPTYQSGAPSYTIPNPLTVPPKVLVGIMEGDISGRSGCAGAWLVAFEQVTGMTSAAQIATSTIGGGVVSPGGMNVTITYDGNNNTITIALTLYDHPNYGWNVIILG